MKGPHAQEWIAAVLEEIESFKRLGVYEEVPKGQATSPPLPARLILVTKPNIHGGPARKKARIVICGNCQDVHPDEQGIMHFLSHWLYHIIGPKLHKH